MKRCFALILAFALMFGIHPAAFSEREAAEPAATPDAAEAAVSAEEPEATPAPAVEATPAPDAQAVPALSLAAGEVSTYLSGSETILASGKCGTYAEWVLYTTGELVITGSGAIYDYTTSSKAPWSSYNTSIKSINVGGTISTIGLRKPHVPIAAFHTEHYRQ